MTSDKEPLDVVAAVILRPDGRFLLAQRPAGKAYAGFWEFPGGKVNAGEDLPSALARELREELGIQVELAYRWVTRRFVYPHASVRLNFYRVVRWRGEPHGQEDQALEWQRADALTVKPVLPANGPILRALKLPELYAITAASVHGEARFLELLEVALTHGLGLIQVREKWMAPPSLVLFASAVVALARRYGAKVLVNGSQEVSDAAGADGVHLTAAELTKATKRPRVEWCGASCHTARDLARAEELGLDFVVLGPVKPTSSHPEAIGLGWERFGDLIRDYPSPAYAIGGMIKTDLEHAWRQAAHGIAAIRSAWQE